MFLSFLSLLKRRFLLPFCVLLLVTGCGQPSAAQLSQKPSTSLLCRSTTSSSGSAPVGTSVTFDLGGCLHVQSISGFVCTANAYNPPGLLVLPTVQPTYDQGTLQLLQNYLREIYKNPGDIKETDGDTFQHRNLVPYPPFSANSNSFQLLAVNDGTNGCDELLHMTNISAVPLQITLASVILTADTQRNTQHYSLIEGCSVLSLAPGCLTGPDSGGGADFYQIDFDLHPGKKNTIIPATTIGNLKNTTLTLQSGEVAEVDLFYTTSVSNVLSFSLMPSFTIGLPGEQPTTYPVPQLQETFAFARSSQFSCYGLQNQQFIKISGAVGWCM